MKSKGNRISRSLKTIVLIVLLFVNLPLNTNACNTEQTKTYVTKMLLGEDAQRYESHEDMKTILNAMYLCCEQENGKGQSELTSLKKNTIRKNLKIEDINVPHAKIYECSHKSWEHEANDLEKKQRERKKILKKGLVQVFDFGFINERFYEHNAQIDSLAAVLYYSHILADYLADNPQDTEVTSNGYDIEAYSGEEKVILQGGNPRFTKAEKLQKDSYREFCKEDKHKRTGPAMAKIGPETLAPENSRQSIGHIKPTGWNQEKYNGFVNSKPPFLYNRCHLIAHELLNYDGADNLITGTRYLNDNMRKREREIVKYVKKTNNHVLYKVTPVYEGDNMVASGVHLEGYSIEDKEIRFNEYLYNVQPGITINYSNGTNYQEDKMKNNKKVIPFAKNGCNKESSDLVTEMREHIEILLKNEKTKEQQEQFLDELKDIGDNARMIGTADDWKSYMELKKFQYEYVECIEKNLPKLLKQESFFKNAFK